MFTAAYTFVDVDCGAPVDTIFAGPFFRCFLLYAEGRPWCIENGLIAVEPANGLIAAILLNVERNLIAYREGRRFRSVWAETGPGATTETITRAAAHQIATGDKATLLDGLLLARNDRAGPSYKHWEMDYKRGPDGNWRMARDPRGSGS